MKHRKRQGLVPDFLDVRNQRFMDVKTMSFGRLYSNARFRHALRSDTVRLRGLQVHKVAADKARDIDIQYNWWIPGSGTLGPVQQRLQGFGRIKGLVVGAHGEFSPDLIDFVEKLAEQGAQSRHRDMGFDSPKAAMSTVKQQVFLALGIEAVKGMARMRIDKLGVALAGNTSTTHGTARRQRGKQTFRQQTEAYERRHCFFDI